MAKPKKGQPVTHKGGQKGKVLGSSSSTTWVHFKGASKPVEVYSSSLHKSSGCLVIAAIPVIVLLIGVFTYGSQAA